MMRLTIFTSTIGDRAAKFPIAVHQNASGESAFTIDLDTDNWSLAVKDAERLAACGRRIEGALDWAAQHNEPVQLEPYFQRQLGFADGSSSKFEIGLDERNGLACAYLEWNGKRAIDGTGRLLKMLAVLGDVTATIRRTQASRRPQDLQVDLQNYRSPIGWDGR